VKFGAEESKQIRVGRPRIWPEVRASE
jgi:hypothetical protein